MINKWNDYLEKGHIDAFYFGFRTEIKKLIQNDSPKFSFIDAISEFFVASDITTHQ